MGALCSVDEKGDHEKEVANTLHKHPHYPHQFHHIATSRHRESRPRKTMAFNLADPWAHVLERPPDDGERTANERLQNARNNDDADIFEKASSFLPLQIKGYQGQLHPRYAGDHFLRNVDLINGLGLRRCDSTNEEIKFRKSQLLEIAEKMPKGAHLHLHFNATLRPDYLLNLAEDQPHMRIWSTRPLRSPSDLEKCEIQFILMNDPKPKLNVFDRAYEFNDPAAPTPDELSERKMLYGDFRNTWKELQTSYGGTFEESPAQVQKRFTKEEWEALQPYLVLPYKEWLIQKLCFQNAEAHNSAQNQDGAWHKFNTRTRMMKGLFNYETAYRSYTKACLEEFERDNVQYAEIRPNFMSTNQIWKDDGSLSLNNANTMEIIIEEYQKFMSGIGALDEQKRPRENRALDRKGNVIYDSSTGLPVFNGNPESRTRFSGLKVIYCTPRSFKRQQIRDALEECLEFKKRWPQYIAGFDLVGEESKGHPLSFFKDILQEFQKRCTREGLEIPFLFHCGETQYDPDNNLETAILDLNTKRIGHGYALLTKPHLKERAQANNLCIESCPISNEVLGLTPLIEAHHVYGLLNEKYHVTLSSDNGTLFNSTLAHDFYQFLVGRREGSQKMTLQVCKRLAEWSLAHACMDKDERERAQVEWGLRWEEFIQWMIDEQRDFKVKKDTQRDIAARKAAEKERLDNLELEKKAQGQ